MTSNEFAILRLRNQAIASTTFVAPADVVAWLGGMQAQDYAGVKWSIGCRLVSATESAMEQAFANKSLVRTWAMRGTLHVVAAADVHWMTDLLAPRLIAGTSARHRQLELDDATFARSNSILASALAGGKQCTRAEITELLEAQGIPHATGPRLSHILWRAGLARMVCFGVRRGKQFTYTLLDEWAPPAKTCTREEALAELAKRYFCSRGPATLQDFAWWSGLTVAEARAGLELIKSSNLIEEKIDGRTHWLPATTAAPGQVPRAYALSGFDEFLLGYQNRDAVLDPQYKARWCPGGNGMFHPFLVLDGQVVGIWPRATKGKQLAIQLQPFTSLPKIDLAAAKVAFEHYATFMELPTNVQFV